ncbi:MAG: cation:proton antiporter [Rhodobacteraceae bacterium]|nr:cation:proton antiporter [Paracoccaceae bacterium]
MGPHVDSVFNEIAALVLLAAGVGFAGLLLRQPLIVAFIAVGVLAGPDAFGLVTSTEVIDLLGEISIAVLLFLVGLRLDLGLVRSIGRVAVATGLGQIGFTSLFGFLICLALGMDAVTALYVAVALTFSSTIIIVKLLSDKHEIGALHGRIALGILIVQDIFVILCMVSLSALGVGLAEDEGRLADILIVAGGGAAMIVFVILFIRYVATPLLGQIARSAELLVIFAVGWAAGLGAAGDWIGFGKELGGLLAGVSLASTPYREAIVSRLASLRDFLLLFFFIALGVGLNLEGLGADLPSAAVLSVFVLVGNPLIVLAVVGAMGYRKRTGFLAGLTVAQISEFSLILMAMGVNLGHVGESALALVTLVGLVTIALSVYMITWSNLLYDWLEPFLGPFERRRPHGEAAEAAMAPEAAARHDFVIIGLGGYGTRIGLGLEAAGFGVLGIDFDPEALRHWRQRGLDAVFGDATDPEFIAQLPLEAVKVVVLAVSREPGVLTEASAPMSLLHGLQAAGYRGAVALCAQRREEAPALLARGATMVFAPSEDAAEYAVERLTVWSVPQAGGGGAALG